MIGERPFAARDKCGELLAAGDPRASASPGTTCTTPTRPAPGTACCAARSTSSARVIWFFEKLGWACGRALADAERIAARRVDADARDRESRRLSRTDRRARLPRTAAGVHRGRNP